MIKGIFHTGSGLGNQLHRYVATRVLAEDKGFTWSMLNPASFKGQSFMDLFPFAAYENEHVKDWHEKKVVVNGVDIRGYDPEINFVENGTTIDGEFQDPRYFEHRMPDIDKWLKVEPLEVPCNTCVIGFRGGEYTVFPDLFLPESYWREGIAAILTKHPYINKFEVHTDDPITADSVFEKMGFPAAIQNIGVNWRTMRHAKYAIIANSSFYILPRLLKHWEDPTSVTIAPRYWARRNTKVWALPQNYYKQFTYI